MPSQSFNRRHFLTRAVAAGALLTPGLIGRSAHAAEAILEPPFPLRKLTRGPKSHFFGYYDKCPWDATGRYLLGLEIGFCDRNPKPGEPLVLGLLDLENAARFAPFDETTAWSWQQGTMLQWMPNAPGREVIYNSVRDGAYVAIVRDVLAGTTRVLPQPIYAVSPDGKRAVTLPFDRLNRLRPGYGYMALPERHKGIAAPEDAGIAVIDIASGEHRLIIPIAWASRNKTDARFTPDAEHWFNHLQFNPSGTRFLFLHRWSRPGTSGWQTRLYTARPDGSDVRLHADDGMTSHFDWRDDRTILAWARVGKTDRFYLFNVDTNESEVMGEGVLTRDGHCSYSPDRRWVLNDTYPDKEHMRTLMLYRPADARRIDIGRFHHPPQLTGAFRCDLHPRWSRDGRQVCIDSAHDGARQLYVIDVSAVVKG